MRLSKVFMFLSAGVLAVCLVLSITTLQVLRNAVSENGRIQENAYSLVEDLSGCVRALGDLPSPALPVDTEEPGKESIDVAARAESYWLRSVGGKIGLYNAGGKLLELFSIPVDALPLSLREELKNGILLSSLEEALELLRELQT